MTDVVACVDSLENIDGWLAEQAKFLTERLIAYQHDNQWVTGALEFGVFRGKYLGLLARECGDVPIVGVDAFLERFGVLLAPEHHDFTRNLILDNIRSVSGRDATLIVGYTRDVGADRLKGICPAYSFISVDAGHDAEDVEYDSGLADKLLSRTGVVAFDDIYNPVCPGVAEGFMHYMIRNPRFAPFATAGNKLFVCRPALHSLYYDYSREIARSVPTTREHLEANERNEWSPRLFGFDVIPFL